MCFHIFLQHLCIILLKQRKTEKNKETGDSKCIYQNKLDKACFQHDMTYRDFEDLCRRTAAYRVLCNKAFNIIKEYNIW